MGPENKQFRVAKLKNSNRFTTALVGSETVVDVFEGDVFSWYLPSMNNRRRSGLVGGLIQGGDADDCYRLSFRTENREKALNHYLRHVVKVFEEMSQQLQLFTWSSSGSHYGGSSWTSMDSRHPMTFDTIALEGKMKQGIVDDLDRFVARREFYKRVGKAWKRGYLLYGPPGTGKSSVVSALSNHLKFNLYVVELANFGSDYELRHALLSIANKSIVVFEDIDCCPELHARSESTKASDESTNDTNTLFPLTLSTLLNCIDGLWTYGRATEKRGSLCSLRTTKMFWTRR
ncbi:unnamed protein product [Linum tenue]|uniref:ATPase AAA-type core domain-containing protein n=1 Tax=Linum tenue TaxID=586396 RepID=A0AAV0JGW6_9ROSI|nr:unnamed protein product [Linum tenue]